jgi:hypothetical protein
MLLRSSRLDFPAPGRGGRRQCEEAEQCRSPTPGDREGEVRKGGVMLGVAGMGREGQRWAEERRAQRWCPRRRGRSAGKRLRLLAAASLP